MKISEVPGDLIAIWKKQYQDYINLVGKFKSWEEWLKEHYDIEN